TAVMKSQKSSCAGALNPADRRNDVVFGQSRSPLSGEILLAQRIQHRINARVHEDRSDVFALHQSHAVSYHAERDEVIVRPELLYYMKDFSRGLIEGLDRGKYFPIVLESRFRQNSKRSVLIDIEAEDFAAKLTVHDNRAGANGVS